MRIPADGILEALRAGDPAAIRQVQQNLSVAEMQILTHRMEWLRVARPKQLPPEDYFVWMLLAGRGSGKTRSGAEDIWWPASREEQRVAVIGPTLADVRKTCFEGESGLMAVVPPRLVRNYNRSLCEMWLTNGSYFVGYSSEEPERLRGPQHHRAWCDELAAWKYIDETWNMMMFGLRLGDDPNVIVTTTPKPVGLIRRLVKDPRTILSHESTYANAANLPQTFLDEMRTKFDGTRLGRQELNAEILDDNPFAFWNMKILEDCRRPMPEEMSRVVVAVDPPVTVSGDADECGIVGAGRRREEFDNRDHAYIIADRSRQGLSPHGWASRAVSLYHELDADCIVAEANQGGEMVRHTISTVDEKVPVRLVRATRGKTVRAEPVSMLYEQNRVHHVGSFPQLEDQMCDFTSDFDKKVMGYSPDRVDALVWAVTALMIDPRGRYSMLDAV